MKNDELGFEIRLRPTVLSPVNAEHVEAFLETECQDEILAGLPLCYFCTTGTPEMESAQVIHLQVEQLSGNYASGSIGVFFNEEHAGNHLEDESRLVRFSFFYDFRTGFIAGYCRRFS